MPYLLEEGGVIFPLQQGRTKAGKLLNSLLDEQQQKELKKDGYFHVRGGKSGKRYRIWTNGYSGNVKQVNIVGLVQKSFCIHVADYVPMEDHFIMQLLLLQHDEDRFLKIARS